MPKWSNIIRYGRKQGILRLVRRAVSYATEPASQMFFEYYIKSNYSDIVVGYEELKSKYADQVWRLEEDLEGLHRNLNQELAPSGDGSTISYDFSPHFLFKHPFVAEVPDITVAGLEALAITPGGRVLAEPIHSPAITPDGRTLSEPTHSLSGTYVPRICERTVSSMVRSPLSVGLPIVGEFPPPSRRKYETVAVLNLRWHNYYHWMIEQLPKLRGIKKYEKTTETDVRLIIPSNPPSYVEESLGLLGYDTEDYVEWDKRSVRVDSLVVPSFPEPTPFLLKWVREQMTSSVCTSEMNKEGLVYISRQNSEGRRVQNFNQVKKVLNKYDIDTVNCEEMSLREQIRLFSTASGIIGPHGAGLTSMVWSTNMKILELFNEVVKGPYYLLAHVLGHDYAAFYGTPIEDDTATKEINRDMMIDPREFESKIDRLVQSQE